MGSSSGLVNQPAWHQALPPHIQFSQAALVTELEQLRDELKLDDQNFMMFLVQSRTVMMRNLTGAYQEARIKQPGGSDRDHFAMVVGARIMRKLEVHNANTSSTAITRVELQGIVADLRNVVSRFSAFDDVLQFFVGLENREKRFDDKSGHIARIDACCSKYFLT